MVRIRLVVWNVHGVPFFAPRHAERFATIAARLRTLDPGPDVILLQEVFSEQDAVDLAVALSYGYKAVDNVPRRFFPPWFLTTFNLGSYLWRIRESGLLAFVRNDWRVKDSGFERFVATESEFKIWHGDGYVRKGAQWLNLVNGTTDMVIINTHLQSGRGQNVVRTAQIDQLATLASRLDQGHDVLICGDFNVRPDEPLYEKLTRELGWRDLTAARPSCHTQMEITRGLRDFVFAASKKQYKTNVRMLCNRVVDDPYSDHDGIDISIIRHAPVMTSHLNVIEVAAMAAFIRPSTRREWLAAAAVLIARKLIRIPT